MARSHGVRPKTAGSSPEAWRPSPHRTGCMSMIGPARSSTPASWPHILAAHVLLSPSDPVFDGLRVWQAGSGLPAGMSDALFYDLAALSADELFSLCVEVELVAWVERRHTRRRRGAAGRPAARCGLGREEQPPRHAPSPPLSGRQGGLSLGQDWHRLEHR